MAPRPSSPLLDADLRHLETIAHWMDGRFRLPGTNRRFGLDAVVGLVPGIGDAAGALVGAYIIFQAYRMGVPRSVLMRMLGNVAVDGAVGSIPVVGDLFDFAFKHHRRNINLLRRHLETNAGAAGTVAPAADLRRAAV